jgi:predicted Zn-dependent protease
MKIYLKILVASVLVFQVVAGTKFCWAQDPPKPTFSSADEEAMSMSELAFADVKKSEKPSANVAFNGRVECIGRLLISSATEVPAGVKWEFYVIQEDEPVVSGFPNGKIIVSTGVETVAKTNDQLAAAISPLIAKVISRDVRRFRNSA